MVPQGNDLDRNLGPTNGIAWMAHEAEENGLVIRVIDGLTEHRRGSSEICLALTSIVQLLYGHGNLPYCILAVGIMTCRPGCIAVLYRT